VTVMVPFQVTAHLQQGVALDARFGVALDGLLAGLLLRQQRGEAYGANDPTDPTVDPDDLELPLARCTAGGDWHWQATCARPQVPWFQEVHTWTKRLGHRQAELAADWLPRSLPSHQGRYRAHRRPLVVTVTRALSWRAVGDPTAAAALLAPVASIGARRNSGEGTVHAWTVTPAPAGDPDRFGHLDADGRLARPCPPGCAARLGTAAPLVATAGIRPPYWHPRRQRHLAVPQAADEEDDGTLQ
jgi:CRISPR type IV-associated protein Csf3